MATTIEWCDESWNPIRARRRSNGKVGWHCEVVSGGCKFCYAKGINRRLGTGLEYKPGHFDSGEVEVFLDEKALRKPLGWASSSMIFPCSMTDLFGRFVHVDDILCVMAVMAMTPWHTYQVVTKRPQRACELFTYFERRWTETAAQRYDLAFAISGDKALSETAFGSTWPLPNVWLLTSTEDQETFDERWPWVSAAPVAVRGISAEPLLGRIRLPVRNWSGPLDWVIVGCESGSSARQCEMAWAEELAADALAQGSALFVKQLPPVVRGKPVKNMAAFPPALQRREFPRAAS